MASKWEQQEAGWWTSDLGGICLEKNGRWYFYPRDEDTTTMGPFRSLRDAMKAVEGTDGLA
jgi:hypothetical protein